MNYKIQIINLSELHSFPENPFKVREDESFNELVLSIRENGLISPLVVRPHENGGYEIISGYRRRLACEKAGLTTVPAIIYTLDRDSAIPLTEILRQSHWWTATSIERTFCQVKRRLPTN